MSHAIQNALATASSAYLRSAMHQPIRWHEWGNEAFEEAKRQNKPVLLDIGAVWCHWCHVMDRESYENDTIAQVINEHYIAIKVDRDERPDVDSRYQAAVQAINGQGGWPLTVFLTSDGRPFFGGTYFPPDNRWGRPGFKQVLLAIADAYRNKSDQVMESAESVMSAVSHAESFAGRSGNVSPTVIEKIIASAKKMFDPHHGGLGAAPKFPHPSAMDLVLDEYGRTGDEALGEIAKVSLTKMAKGGVYDQLAGGFHRYSVDERWIVPHFEKMSYDNSELLKNYVHAYQNTRDLFFAHVAKDIIRWMDEWLSDRERGGFYGSQDADIDLDDDGDYFTWTLDEAKAVLMEDELKVASLHYEIGEIGEMHHDPAKNVLHVRAEIPEIAARTSKSESDVEALLASAKQKMYAARRQRPTPYIDKTIYVGWNALCISAYLDAARVLELEEARKFALRSLDRLLAEAWKPERGMRHVIAYSDTATVVRDVRGMLDDYAFTAVACLDAYETTADLSYFRFALQITDAMMAKFADDVSGGFLDTELGSGVLGALSAKRKPFQDAPLPAGNPAAVIALLRLFAYTNDAKYRDKAEDTLEVFGGIADQFGIFAATYGIAVRLFSEPHAQVVVVGDDDAANQLLAAGLTKYRVGRAVIRVRPGEVVAANLPPALAETIPNLPQLNEQRSFAVVCRDFACMPPVNTPEELEKLLA